MSQSNVELARAVVDHWNEGVRSVPTEFLDPSVELESPFSSVAGMPYRGHAGIERWARDIDEHFAEWRVQIDEMREVGAEVVTIGSLRGRGRGSAIELDQAFASVIGFGADHRITRVRIYWEVDAALKAVGLEG
jgi:ketosteroid isomerase-like protein